MVSELGKQIGWSAAKPEIYHYRSTRQEEIDIVLEDRRRVIGIEVKANANVKQRDFRHLATLRDELGDRFIAGLVLHTGDQAIPFGPKLHTLPISGIWQGGPTAERTFKKAPDQRLIRSPTD